MLIQSLLQIDGLVQSTNAWDWVIARLISEEGGQMKVCMWWYLLYQTQHVTSCWVIPGSRSTLFMSEFHSPMMLFTEDSNMVSASAQIILLLHSEGRTPWQHFKSRFNMKQVFWKVSNLKLQGNYWKQSRAHDAYCRGKSLCMVLVHCKRESLFFGTTHNIQKAAAPCCLAVQALCSTGSASVVVERLRDFGMALELGDQVLLCPCSVMLFSSGPLGREETGLTSHMKPEYRPGETVVLGCWWVDVEMNGQVSFPSVLSPRAQP